MIMWSHNDDTSIRNTRLIGLDLADSGKNREKITNLKNSKVLKSNRPCG